MKVFIKSIFLLFERDKLPHFMANSYFEVLINKHLLQDLFFLSFVLTQRTKSQGFISILHIIYKQFTPFITSSHPIYRPFINTNMNIHSYPFTPLTPQHHSHLILLSFSSHISQTPGGPRSPLNPSSHLFIHIYFPFYLHSHPIYHKHRHFLLIYTLQKPVLS